MEDKIYEVKVANNTIDTMDNTRGTHPALRGGNLTSSYPYYTITNSSPTYWTYPSAKYFYQIICPKRNCKTANWLELDTIKACTNCNSRLKAVSESPADFEVPVTL